MASTACLAASAVISVGAAVDPVPAAAGFADCAGCWAIGFCASGWSVSPPFSSSIYAKPSIIAAATALLRYCLVVYQQLWKQDLG